MKILAIETSCDETAIAILSVKNGRCEINAESIASQIEIHQQYGGVFPMMAKREHSKNILPLMIETFEKGNIFETSKTNLKINEKKIKQILEREPELLEKLLVEIPKIKKPKMDRIVVTVGPGLTPALWVGINFARALSITWNIPIVPVNHMEGHVLSVAVTGNEKDFDIKKIGINFPAISLLVSGGHTEIVLAKGIGKYKIIGKTRDDAAGEAFDKVARMLELPYPGGPEISKLAQIARSSKNKIDGIKLPRPMIGSKDFDFSFSGLKTAVLYLLRDLKKNGTEITIELKQEIAREFEDAVVDVLVSKTISAVKKNKSKMIIVGGGVSANKELKKRLTEESEKYGIPSIFPTKNLSTDNAVMIGLAGYFGKKVSVSSKKLIANGNLELK